MMHHQNGLAEATCVENWAYAAGCPLPVCDPGGCADGQPYREYFKCRLNNVATSFASTWLPGDILFFGDSITDIATAYNIFPILPRAFNAAVLGARICDVTAALDTVQGWITSLATPSQPDGPLPSKAVVMVGTNDLIRDVNGVDNSFTPATAAKYEELFARLDLFKSANNQCEIIIRNVPPGVPLPSGCCTDGYIPDKAAFQQAVLEANAFLAPLCAQYGFTFLDDYAAFWNEETANVRSKLYRGGDWLNPCNQTHFTDLLHFGCKGQMVALMDCARMIYLHANHQGAIADLDAAPYGPPLKTSTNPDPAMMYRYIHRKVEPNETLTLQSKRSSFNYVAILIPGTVGGLPVAEELQTDGSKAQVTYTNTANRDYSLVLCIGTDPADPGQYVADVE